MHWPLHNSQLMRRRIRCIGCCITCSYGEEDSILGYHGIEEDSMHWLLHNT